MGRSEILSSFCNHMQQIQTLRTWCKDTPKQSTIIAFRLVGAERLRNIERDRLTRWGPLLQVGDAHFTEDLMSSNRENETHVTAFAGNKTLRCDVSLKRVT